MTLSLWTNRAVYGIGVECPHGYTFDTCTQCHEAYHAGVGDERRACERLVADLGANTNATLSQFHSAKQDAFLEAADAIRARGTNEQ